MAASSGTAAGGYESFFGLKESPFSLTPNPRFLFESATHRAALEQVTYALGRREPLVVVTGEIGTGKTMLCRTMLQRLERLTFLSVISDPLLERDDLLKQILEDFGVISKGRGKAVQPGRHELVLALQEFLASLIPLQAHAVVMIDEAQHLAPSVLEEIRLLSNIEAEQGTQLQIVLVGQTDLDVVLKRPEMRQFEQRVTRRCRLMPLDAQEVRKYIEHRLEVAQQGQVGQAGREGQVGLAGLAGRESRTGRALFATDAMDAVAHLSGGLPRVINIICDRALEAAFGLGQQTVERSAVESAARALGLSLPAVPAPPASPALPPASAAERPAVPAPPAGEASDFDRLFDEVAASAPHHDVAPHASWSNAIGRPALPNLSERRDLPDPPDLSSELLSASTFEAPAAESKTRQYVIAGVGIVVIAVAAWFATRGPAAPAAEVAPAANPSPAPAASTPAVPPAVPPVTPAAPQAAPSDPPPAASPAAPPPAAAPPEATGERFEIVVASFRTESRVTAVAAEVEALGMPHRTRTAGEGWRQVLAGPYSSRADAEAAQRRLDAAGLTGTQIVVR